MILQLKIKLAWSSPPIWRQVLVDSETDFEGLHDIIQVVMDWEWSHLYEFRVAKLRIGEIHGYDIDHDKGTTEASGLTLGSLIKKEKQKFEYVYDFGDSWVHEILVEKILPKEAKKTYPICIAGKMNAPVEDCGGMGGFYQMLEIVADKKHEDWEEMNDWLGEDYDPKHFDMKEINQKLKGY